MAQTCSFQEEAENVKLLTHEAQTHEVRRGQIESGDLIK